MSHLAGTDATYFLNYDDYDPFSNLRAYLADVNLKYPPGTKVVRSGAMIDLLRLVLQHVGGQPFADLAQAGGGVFRAAGAVSVRKAVFSAPGDLELELRNGMVIKAERIVPAPAHQAWLERRGTYRLADPVDNALYAFTLDTFNGLPVISSGDDGVQFLVDPRPDSSAGIRCNEASRLFGRDLAAPAPGELSLGGVRYRLIH